MKYKLKPKKYSVAFKWYDTVLSLKEKISMKDNPDPQFLSADFDTSFCWATTLDIRMVKLDQDRY